MDMDTFNYEKAYRPLSRSVLTSWNDSGFLTDAFWFLNPDTKDFTFKEKSGLTRSRLDYCLASQDMLSVITKVSHIYHDFEFKDQKSVLIEIDTNYEAQGCGIFRAAPYLLKNIKYQSTIKDTIYATII